MRSQSIALLAAAFLAVAASAALAQNGGGDPGGDPGGCNGPCGGGGGGGGNGVPGPVAGAGLGYLVLAGGYYVVRRWRKQTTGE